MAHKTLVNGTAYDMGGGVTLVSGTSYSIKNGKVLIGGTAYDISFVLPPAVLDLWGGSGNYHHINCLTYANGYWVVGGKYSDGSAHYARIAYATSLDGTWTRKDLWSGAATSSRETSASCIIYANGYWVVGGSYYSSTENSGARIAYGTSLEGTWATKDLWSGRDSMITCITYASDYWVVGGMYGTGGTRNYARIAYATSLDATWTTKDLWSGGNRTVCVNGLVYANGYWLAGGESYSSKYYAYISYATKVTGSWTLKELWNGGSGTYASHINCVTYANGYWVVGGQSWSSGSSLQAQIAYTTNITGSWTEKVLWGNSGDIYCITYTNGYWAVGGHFYDKEAEIWYGRVAYATSLGSSWTTRDVWSSADVSSSLYHNNVNAITCANDYWLVGGGRRDGTTYYARLAYAGSLDELGNTE